MPRTNLRRSPKERRTIADRYIRLTADDLDAVEAIRKYLKEREFIDPSLSVIVSRLLRKTVQTLNPT